MLIAKRIIDLESEDLIMKKIIALLMSAILMISLASCGGGGSSTSSSESPEKKVISAAENSVSTKIALNYKTQGAPTFDSYCNHDEELDTYTVTGKVKVKDDYGDIYSAKYTVYVDYDAEKGKANVTKCDLDTPTKD